MDDNVKRTLFIDDLMRNSFNQSTLFKSAVAQVSLAAKVIKNKLQSRRQPESLTDEQLAQQRDLDQLSKHTKRNSQYRTKARTILFHLVSDILKGRVEALQLPYHDLNLLPRYDAPCTNQLKANERYGVTNDDLYLVYPSWVATKPKRPIYDVYQEKIQGVVPVATESAQRFTNPTLYWTLPMAQCIESCGMHIVKHLYKKYETISRNEKQTVIDNKKAAAQATDEPKGAATNKNLLAVKENEIVSKLLTQLICELDHVMVVQYLITLTTDPNESYALHPLILFLKALNQILFSVGDGIENKIEGQRNIEALTSRHSVVILETLLTRAKYLKYRRYNPSVLNDHSDHVPYDLSMFSNFSRNINCIYCWQADKKIPLALQLFNPVCRQTQRTLNVWNIVVNDGSGLIFDVIDLPGFHFDDLRVMSWYQRLQVAEDVFRNRTNMVQFRTVLPDLQRIGRLQILYDDFEVADSRYLYLKTSGLGIATFFMKDCKSVDRQRSKRTKRQKKTQQDDLILIPNIKRPKVEGPLDLDLELDDSQAPLYNKNQHLEPFSFQAAPTEYTRVASLADEELGSTEALTSSATFDLSQL